MPAADSIMVERMRAAGAIFIGKTNTPEFGLGSHTYNPVYGATRNAYDHDALGRRQQRRRGGRAGAAHAAGRRRQRLRRQPAQSGRLEQRVRLPHQLRPRAARRRATPGCRRWACIGPMARNVADLALLLSVQAGYDARVPLSLDGRRRAVPRPPGRAIQAASGSPGSAISAARCPTSRACSSLPGRAQDVRGDRLHRRGGAAGLSRRRRLARLPDAARVADRRRRCSPIYGDPAKRALLKPEAMFEVESGLKLSAYRHHRRLGGAHRMVSGGAAVLRDLRLLRRADRAGVPVRRRTCTGRSEIAGTQDGDLSRVDEGRDPGHHGGLVRRSRCRRASATTACRSASRSSARTTPSSRACNSPMPTTSRPTGPPGARRRCWRRGDGSPDAVRHIGASHPQRLLGGDVRQLQRVGDGLVGQRVLVDVEAGAQMRVLLQRAPEPLSASARPNGRVALLSAKVEVRATAPGMLATQ